MAQKQVFYCPRLCYDRKDEIDRMRSIELLVPAGSLEILKTAVVYGADAVYIGGEAFGLRAKAKNFPWRRCGRA